MKYKSFRYSKYLSPKFQIGGRLGNVMFTLAAAYVHSLKVGVELRVPWNFNDASRALGKFLDYPFKATIDGKNEGIAYKEPHFHYAPIPEEIKSGGLHGYFQSWKYFEGYEDVVRKLYDKFISKEHYSDRLGFHIRLGDYKDLFFKHRTADPVFLKRAIASLPGGVYDSKPVLFSDEPLLAYNTLRDAARGSFIDGVRYPSGDGFAALKKMTECDAMVISASTFSWWGAWLGQAKTVIYPKEWFLSQIEDYQDVCPPHWIAL